MKFQTFIIKLFIVLILIPIQTFCADEVKEESLQLFYSQFKRFAEPEFEYSCGVGEMNFTEPFCEQLKQKGTDFDLLLESVLEDQTKRPYWHYALFMYKLRYKQEPFIVQKKNFELLERSYNFNDETILHFYSVLILNIESTIYETNKANPMVYSYFKNDAVATIKYWQNKLTQQYRNLEPSPEIDPASYNQTHDRTITLCATTSMEIAVMLYLLSDEMDYYNLIVKAKKSNNQKINQHANYLLTEQHLSTMRTLMHL